ncbi:ABC transporter ATP-binding protein [Anaerotalea alkaliphila]|uniref:ABC transporter ATP-binding protein n=1 Tax=Anaerotalea alkaliphila TaxID=2662126 RepID=A0A7X5KMX2_9FIRM|nr:ABC transporter ATP-binding protein [Anaerotalea alkaliphila]NDL67158.1 ABC transporter ATP-binding protein [Anaerotalea alkaliphila]
MEKSVFTTEKLEFGNFIHYPDMEIPEAPGVFLTGPSGSGKSTLLRLLNGTLSPSSGSIRYQGRDLETWDTLELRREVLLVGQSVFLFDGTIEGNFREFYGYRNLPAPSRERMETFLGICSAPFPLDKDCRTMSGGERQRVYMAIFLSFGPRVLLLDEPTSALDAKNSHGVVKDILAHCAREGIAAIIVSHDNSLVEAFALHRILI